MLQFEELRLKVLELEEQLKYLREAIGYDHLKSEEARLEALAAQPGFWDDQENSQKVLRETSSVKNKIKSYDALQSDYDYVLTLIDLAVEA